MVGCGELSSNHSDTLFGNNTASQLMNNEGDVTIISTKPNIDQESPRGITGRKMSKHLSFSSPSTIDSQQPTILLSNNIDSTEDSHNQMNQIPLITTSLPTSKQQFGPSFRSNRSIQSYNKK